MENEEAGRTVATSEEDFINTLTAQRDSRELRSLSERLVNLQKRLQEVKQKTEENKIMADVNLLKEISANLSNLSELNSGPILNEEINKTLSRIVKLYNLILDDKFGSH